MSESPVKLLDSLMYGIKKTEDEEVVVLAQVLSPLHTPILCPLNQLLLSSTSIQHQFSAMVGNSYLRAGSQSQWVPRVSW